MKTLFQIHRTRWTSRVGFAALTVALSALLVTAYKLAIEQTGNAVHTVLSSGAPVKPHAPALADARYEPAAWK